MCVYIYGYTSNTYPLPNFFKNLAYALYTLPLPHTCFRFHTPASASTHPLPFPCNIGIYPNNSLRFYRKNILYNKVEKLRI